MTLVDLLHLGIPHENDVQRQVGKQSARGRRQRLSTACELVNPAEDLSVLAEASMTRLRHQVPVPDPATTSRWRRRASTRRGGSECSHQTIQTESPGQQPSSGFASRSSVSHLGRDHFGRDVAPDMPCSGRRAWAGRAFRAVDGRAIDGRAGRSWWCQPATTSTRAPSRSTARSSTVKPLPPHSRASAA